MLGCLQQTALLILKTIIIGLLAAVDDTGDIDSIGLPKTRTVGFGPRSFSVAGPSLWIVEHSVIWHEIVYFNSYCCVVL